MLTKNLKKPQFLQFFLRSRSRGKRRKIKSQTGFTMIELLVVIVILGLLSTIGLGSFRSSQAKSRDVRRKAELGQIARALEMYFNDHKEYPEVEIVPVTGGLFTDGNTNYMIDFPQDPSGGSYRYERPDCDDGRTYILMARLENIRDKDALSHDFGDGEEAAVYAGTGLECGGGMCLCGNRGCNYLISSTNVKLKDYLMHLEDI